MPTASRGCARCCCPRIDVAGPVPPGVGAGAWRCLACRMPDAGRSCAGHRWSSPPALERSPEAQAAVEHVARVLLERWGVVFWKVYQREAQWLPPWRELLMVYRRLEARGEIRGGRFVAGFSGEQYATPAAIGALRESRRRNASDEYVSISAADPLNVVGLLTPGPRVPALTGNRILYRDGSADRSVERRRSDLPGNNRWLGAVGSTQSPAAQASSARPRGPGMTGSMIREPIACRGP